MLQMRFINISRRNKLLARWAFRKTDLPDEKRDEYVYSIVKSFIFIPSDMRLITNIVHDLNSRGIVISRNEVIQQLRKIEKKLGIFRARNIDDEK